MVCQTYCFSFLGAQPMKCSIKLPLSVCPSVSLAFFSGIAHYLFWYSNICSKIFVSSASEIFMKNFRTAIFLNIGKRIFMLCIFLAELKPVLLGNFHLFSASWNGKTQIKDLFLWNKALISFQLKVYPLFHWSWYAIFITKAITEWTIFYIKTFSFVSSVLIK